MALVVGIIAIIDFDLNLGFLFVLLSFFTNLLTNMLFMCGVKKTVSLNLFVKVEDEVQKTYL